MLRTIFRTFLLPILGVFCLAGWGSFAHAKAIEGVVNLNTATVFELSLLPGIGKAKAERIVQMRQAKPFTSVEELKAVKGLGGRRLELLRPHLVLSGPTTAKSVKEAAVKPASPPPGHAVPPVSPK